MKKIVIILTAAIVFANTVIASEAKIKWVEFNVTAKVMERASETDIETYRTGSHKDWISLIALMACENGNDFSNSTEADVDKVTQRYEELIAKWKDKKIFRYYHESYSAALGGLLGNGVRAETNDDGSVTLNDQYGICAFSPIAGGYGYSHYDDFGASRSFGYRRRHLGHDLMCDTGTPVIAIESGYVETCGWNIYGGWRIGIRSFDSNRYYYYAHLRKGHPYCDVYVGKTVAAGEVIGYAGMTGYSSKEDTNNINVPHLHLGEELIFSPEQKDGYCQIWIDMYEITKFLENHRSNVEYRESDGEMISKSTILGPGFPE